MLFNIKKLEEILNSYSGNYKKFKKEKNNIPKILINLINKKEKSIEECFSHVKNLIYLRKSELNPDEPSLPLILINTGFNSSMLQQMNASLDGGVGVFTAAESYLNLVNKFPKKIERITILYDFNKLEFIFKRAKYLNSLRMDINYYYNELDNSFQYARRLKILQFGDMFNKKLDVLQGAKKLKVLKLGTEFNQKLDSLKKIKTLRVLKLGQEFNQSITNLPKNLKVLKIAIGLNFSRNLMQHKISLPKNLKVLEISGSMEWGLELFLKNAKKIKILKLDFSNLSLPNLPKTLKKLIIGHTFYNKIENLPKKLKTLKIGNSFNKPLIIPKNLKVLDIGDNFDKTIRIDSSDCLLSHSEKNKNPSRLKILKLGNSFNQELGKFLKNTKKLKELYLGYSFNQKLSKLTKNCRDPYCKNFHQFFTNLKLVCAASILPKKLEVLKLGYHFNDLLIANPGGFPKNLKILDLKESQTLNYNINSLLESAKKLRVLRFGIYDKQINFLPKTLKIFSKTDIFNQNLKILPKGLQRLEFDRFRLDAFNNTEKLPSKMQVFISGRKSDIEGLSQLAKVVNKDNLEKLGLETLNIDIRNEVPLSYH